MQITTVDEAKTFYPLFGLGANVALIFSGRAVKYFSQVCHATFFGAQLICRLAAHARPFAWDRGQQGSADLEFLQTIVSQGAHVPQVRAKLPPGVDGWGYSLKGMMSMVVFGGLLITVIYWALQRTVVPRVTAGQPKKKKQKSNMSVGESFSFLAKSPYIRDLATLVSLHSKTYLHCPHTQPLLSHDRTLLTK